MATTAEIQTVAAATAANLVNFTTVQLRKIVASEYGIKGMSSARKADLLAAIYAAEVERAKVEEVATEIEKGSTPQEALATVDAKPADVAKRDGKGKVRGTKCQVCGTAKIDKKTQGRDSTMCTDCYDYAGWENSHTDEAHEKNGADADCPVCAHLATLDAEEDAKPAAKKSGKAKKVENATDASPKALRFAEDARKAGWDAEVTVSGSLSLTVAVCADGRSIELVWAGSVYAYDLSKFKTVANAKGSKIRNASAARMILDA